jgi:hypothetical protein
MTDDRPQDPEPRRAQQADEEAERRFQALTGMSVEAARAWVAYSAGVSRAPRRS